MLLGAGTVNERIEDRSGEKARKDRRTRLCYNGPLDENGFVFLFFFFSSSLPKIQMFDQHHAEDVGRILLQTQEELKSLREKVAQGTASSADMEAVIVRAEADLRSKAELVLSAVTQNSAEEIKPVSRGFGQSWGDGHDRGWTAGSMESTNNLKSSRSSASGTPQMMGSLGRRGGNYDIAASRSGNRSRSRLRQRMADARELEYTVVNPTSSDARRYLRERFGIPYKGEMPPGHKRPGLNRGSGPAGGRRKRGGVHGPQAMLPRANRVNPAANPPAISEEDISKGILNLVNRGFIPPNVDLSAAFSSGAPPVTQAPVRLHDWGEQFQRAQPYVSPFGFNISNVKLDVSSNEKNRGMERQGAGRGAQFGGGKIMTQREPLSRQGP